MGRLDGKVCIITGGNSGIGAKTGEIFAKEGAKVVLMDRRDSHMDKVMAPIKKAGAEGLFIKGDTTVVEDVENVFKTTVEKFGKVDVLVNCAGRLEEGMKPIDEFTDEDYDLIITTNLRGTMNMTREALKYMREPKKGSIVNIASISALRGNGSAVYVASKGGIVALTYHVALRFAGTQIRCNSIAPGTVWTPMTRRSIKETRSDLASEFYDTIQAHCDAGTHFPICKDHDVANIALFLASDEARSVTGQVIAADFGSNM